MECTVDAKSPISPIFVCQELGGAGHMLGHERVFESIWFYNSPVLEEDSVPPLETLLQIQRLGR